MRSKARWTFRFFISRTRQLRRFAAPASRNLRSWRRASPWSRTSTRAGFATNSHSASYQPRKQRSERDLMAEFFASEFWTGFLWPLIVMVAQSLLLLVVLLITIAYILLADRKIWAAVQIRRGPNVVGPWGLLQSFADLLKFVLKEPIIPSGSNKGVFLLAPLVSCVLALAAWAVIPMDLGWVISDINVGVLYIFAISSLSIYGIIMAGWSSNSKYPFLAALRSAAQMVSYEVSIGFVIITVLLCAGSLNLGDIVEAQASSGLAHLLGVPWLKMLNWYWLQHFTLLVVSYILYLA